MEEIFGLGMLHEFEESREVGLVHLGAASLVLLSLCGLEVFLEVCVVGIDLESFLVGIDGIIDAVHVEQGAALALVASGPGWVHFEAGLCVLEGFVVLCVVEVGA